MGFFDKKYCDICGEKIGLLGNRKLDDGNLCKDCAKKLSPWFEERRHSTVDQIKEQLAYREANKEKVAQFQISRQYKANIHTVYIDDAHGWFAITDSMDVENNPDIVELSQITGCRLDSEESRREEKYRDSEGEMKSYIPARYRYSYRYKILVSVDSPWFDDMDFYLHSMAIDTDRRREIMEMENLGNEIVAALSGRGNNMGMNNGMYGQPMGMNNGGFNTPLQHAGVQQNQMPQQNMAQQQMNGGSWTCSCGTVNTGKFCMQCGQPRPQPQMQARRQIRCDKCGWVPENPDQIPKFCPQCGDPINQDDLV